MSAKKLIEVSKISKNLTPITLKHKSKWNCKCLAKLCLFAFCSMTHRTQKRLFTNIFFVFCNIFDICCLKLNFDICVLNELWISSFFSVNRNDNLNWFGILQTKHVRIYTNNHFFYKLLRKIHVLPKISHKFMGKSAKKYMRLFNCQYTMP